MTFDYYSLDLFLKGICQIFTSLKSFPAKTKRLPHDYYIGLNMYNVNNYDII